MDGFTLVSTLLCCLITFLCLQKWLKWRKFIAALDRLPGPPGILANLKVLTVDREDAIAVSTKLDEQYGPIFRIRALVINFCIISKPEYVKEILTQETTKGVAYMFLEAWLGTGLLTSSGAKWALHRKLLTPSFHFAILETFVASFNEKSKILENKLRQVKPGDEFNMYEYICMCSLDIVCDTVMGIDMHCQDANRDNQQSKYISAIYQILEATTVRLLRPWFYFDWIFYNLSSEGKGYSKCLKLLHDFSNKVVKDKITSNGSHNQGVKRTKPFLDLLLEASGKEQLLTHEEVREEVDTIMFEGHDTTTSAICWAILLLGNNPQIQDKVIEELDCIFQGEERNITSTDLKEMKYLERVIKETLRLYPSVPFFDRTLQKEIKLGEHVVPAGVELRIAVYHMHRSALYFDNPETFDPDNFLPEKERTRHPFAYIPFSAGPRNCIGQKFAMMEMKAILARIFLNFRVQSVEKIEDIHPICDIILKPKTGLRVKIYPKVKQF